tara:strand:- start:344 stop:868 length:525 start_codon:yes stop_codon:yes gene_type:complete
MLKKVKCNLDFSVFIDCNYPEATTCIKHQTKELKDIHDQFGKFPTTYTYANTGIHQKWWDKNEIDYNEIGEQLQMDVITISSIKQPPGNVVPWHRDTFYQIKKRVPDRKGDPVRANIYLEDWKLGHFIQYGNEVSTHWKQGEGFLWNSEVLHLGANAGMETKYTLQVSGFLKNE